MNVHTPESGSGRFSLRVWKHKRDKYKLQEFTGLKTWMRQMWQMFIHVANFVHRQLINIFEFQSQSDNFNICIILDR